MTPSRGRLQCRPCSDKRADIRACSRPKDATSRRRRPVEASRRPAGARPASCRNPDREPARHHPAGAGNPRRGRRDRLRGHPRHPQAARPLRIATPLTPYHEHNAEAARPKLLARLAAGRGRRARLRRRNAAGFRSRLQAGAGGARGRPRRHRGPGPLRRAGGADRCGPADRPVLLRGLPARRRTARGRRASPSLSRIPATLVLFESGPRHRARRSRDLADGLGARQAAVCRELTKLHEEVRRGDLAALAARYAEGAETRGEFVIVVEPPGRCGRARRERGRRVAARAPCGHASVKDAVSRSRRSDRTAAAGRSISARWRWRRSGDDATTIRADPRAEPEPRPQRLAFRLGLSAESRAAAYLIAKGYRIVARRFRSPVGEIDIVARRGGVLVFVEVKARDTLDDAAEVAQARQQRRIIAAAASWLARNPHDANATSASTPCWSRRGSFRATFRRRSTPAREDVASQPAGRSLLTHRSLGPTTESRAG